MIWRDKNNVPWILIVSTPILLCNDFVLASKQTSQIIAQKTDLRVYFGHEMETLAFDAKQEEVKSFYDGSKSDAWLKNTKVSWVIYRPLERSLNQIFCRAKPFSLFILIEISKSTP